MLGRKIRKHLFPQMLPFCLLPTHRASLVHRLTAYLEIYMQVLPTNQFSLPLSFFPSFNKYPWRMPSIYYLCQAHVNTCLLEVRLGGVYKHKE